MNDRAVQGLELTPRLVRKALEAAPDPMVIIDASGIIQYSNLRTREVFGFPGEELLGQTIEQLMPDWIRPLHVEHRRNFFESPRIRPIRANLELVGRRKDGDEFPIEVSLSPIQGEDRLLVAAAIRDTTAHKFLEDQLKRARDSAVEANDVKSRFLAAASHDLRQPLQTIWSIQAFLSRVVDDPALAPQLSLLEAAVRSMDYMLSELVDINRLERGAIHPVVRDFSLDEILPRLRSDFAYSASSKSIVLDIEKTSVFARSDPMLLPVVLRNLIGNAIKYTQRGAVHLRVRREGPDLCVDIVDTGPGIDARHLERLFDAFYQVDNPGRDQRRGVGLGLSIVQTICRLLDHTVNVTSRVGEGSTFTVRLPAGVGTARKPEPPAAAPAQNLHSRAGSVTVLHVEDDPGVSQSMALVLQLEGYNVVSASSRDEALAQIRERGIRPDIILCDFNLPMGFTGDEIIAEIAIMLGFRPLTIMLTGVIGDRQLKKARQVADRILPKPVDVGLVLTAITSLLENPAPTAGSTINRGHIAKAPPFADRCDADFPALATPSYLAIVDEFPQSAYGLWADLRLAYVNKAWYAELDDGDGLIPSAWPIGRSVLDAVPACLQPWYRSLFVEQSDAGKAGAKAREYEYECSSATLCRRYAMKIFPLAAGGRTGFAVVNSLRFEVPHVESDRIALPPDGLMYADSAQLIHQCVNCRRVEVTATPGTWHWVPDWVRHPPINVSDVLCAKCRTSYYP